MEEVEALCGKAFSRKGSEGHRRGGSDPGSVILQGQRIAVKKPRLRRLERKWSFRLMLYCKDMTYSRNEWLNT
jgi:hypothetical protein